jgi:diguanylate cyclase (GGDEF)-like protein
MYYFYLVMEFLMLFGSLAFYIYIRIKGRRLRFFFFWVYILPIVIGVFMQTSYYGLSLIAPCLLIALTGLMSTIQNELIFKDKLTGLYNRYHLDQLGEEFRNSGDSEYTFIMIDINDFKSINDRLGHLTGDRAIIDTANIIKKAIGSSGAGIRYAGDEFVIVLSTRSQIDTDIFVTNIRKGFDEFNSGKDHPYELHVSMGQSKVKLNEVSMDEVMNRIDKLMYEDKRRYYKKRAKAESQ